MKKLPWKQIAIGSLVLTALVVIRAAVSLGRASYWHQSLLSSVQRDPWIYVGFAALALAIVAWTMLPGKVSAHPADDPQEDADNPQPQ